MVGGAGWGAGDARKKERKKTSMGVGRGSWKGLKADAPPPGYQGDAIEGRTTGGGGGGARRDVEQGMEGRAGAKVTDGVE